MAYPVSLMENSYLVPLNWPSTEKKVLYFGEVVDSIHTVFGDRLF